MGLFPAKRKPRENPEEFAYARVFVLPVPGGSSHSSSAPGTSSQTPSSRKGGTMVTRELLCNAIHILPDEEDPRLGSHEGFREARAHLKQSYAYLEFGMYKEAISEALLAMAHPEVRPFAREVLAYCLRAIRRKGLRRGNELRF